MTVLSQIDLSPSLSRDEYLEQLARYQIALGQLGYQVYLQKRPVVIAFEGWDAAGKGSVIRRLTEGLDPRGYIVWPIAAPTGEDQTHPYLYRFWRRLPERGTIAIFDRSWYGRVLIDRVEDFASEAEWERAYREINAFERQLADFGATVFKFWLQISQDEQLRRFQDRQQTPYKAWKLSPEDWRNREKWDLYQAAVDEMLLKTSTAAPWTIVEGNDKWWERVKVLRTVVEGLAEHLKYQPEILKTGLAKGKGKKGLKSPDQLLEAIDTHPMAAEAQESGKKPKKRKKES